MPAHRCQSDAARARPDEVDTPGREWIHQASPAIRTPIPIVTLLDQVAQCSTFSEAHLAALEV